MIIDINFVFLKVVSEEFFMDVNNFILNEIEDNLYDYSYHNRDDFAKFLFFNGSFPDKQNVAINIIENIMAAHGKKEVLRNISYLARVEYGVLGLDTRYRDHVVHALLSFFIGIYLKEKFLRIKNISFFQWKLASLFHDIAYPVQISNDILMGYFQNINTIKEKFQNENNIKIRFDFEGLIDLENGKNGLDIIQEQFSKWEIFINSRNLFKKMIENNNICHGIIGSLSLLNIIDCMYQKFNPERKHKDIFLGNINWNEDYFENDIIPACSAIFLHNLDSKFFRKFKIKLDFAPLAYLLKLSDSLQEWERPSQNNIEGFDSNMFNLHTIDNRLYYISKIPEARLNKIREEISSCLDPIKIEFIRL